MANIPVEKKSSTSWIWWLLLILGIIALLWWLFASNDDEAQYVAADNEPVVAETAAVEPAAGADAGAITALSALSGGAALVGREVRLDNVPVNQVVGDEGFTIGEGANQTLVMFDEYPTPDTPIEGQVDVDPGSRVSIEGTVENYEGDVPASVSREVSENAQIKIRASSVNVVN